jgi:hypothetical protein
MIVGLDGSKWTIVSDPTALVNTEPPVEVVLWRGYDGWRDDPRFVEHRRQTVGLRNKNGSVLWGAYMFLGYSSTSEGGGVSYSAARGDAQASNFWSLITAGGIEWQVPAAIDVEYNSFIDDAGNTQRMPLPNVFVYADTYLLPAIRKLRDLMGRLPILYSNPDIILHYLAPLKGQAAYQDIFDCPLWVADYNPVKADGNYAYFTGCSKYWPKWLIHQTRGSVRDWPGTNNIDVNRCQGTRAQWKAWCKDATQPLPQEGLVDPVPEPEPEPTPDPAADWAAAVAQINAKLDAMALQLRDVDADVTVMRSHFRP